MKPRKNHKEWRPSSPQNEPNCSTILKTIFEHVRPGNSLTVWT